MNIKVCILAALAAVSFASVAADRTLEELTSSSIEVRRKGSREEWTNFLAGLTKGEMRTIADDFIAGYATNKLHKSQYIAYVILDEWTHNDAASSLAEEYDTKFANAGIMCLPQCYKHGPKCVENWLASSNGVKWAQGNPLRLSLTRERKSGYFFSTNTEVPQLANILVEAGAFSSKTPVFRPDLAKWKGYIKSGAANVVKRGLRKQGKPIVVGADGRNLVQEELDKLTTALDAPKFAGLKEWIATYYPDYTWVDAPNWKSDAEIAKFKDDVFYGDLPFDDYAKFMLQVYLGVTEYNKFVREFNK